MIVVRTSEDTAVGVGCFGAVLLAFLAVLALPAVLCGVLAYFAYLRIPRAVHGSFGPWALTLYLAIVTGVPLLLWLV